MHSLFSYYKENKFGFFFILFGIIIQIISWYANSESIIALISGISGVISVVLCSQKKISFYLFAWIQLLTYFYLAINQRFYGEIAEYTFYALTMIYGMYVWKKHYDSSRNVVNIKSLSVKNNILISFIVFILILITSRILEMTDDTQPMLDSLSTVPAFAAQILMILRYREQWAYWLVIDIASVIMWINAENWCMVMQFVFWTLNCSYGTYKWLEK